MTTLRDALQDLAQGDLTTYLSQDEERQIDASLTEHLDAQYKLMLAAHSDPLGPAAAVALKRSLLLRRVAHLVTLINEMPDADEDTPSMASSTHAADPVPEPAPDHGRRRSNEAGWPEGPPATSEAPCIQSVVVSQTLRQREDEFTAGSGGARWLGGPLLWNLAATGGGTGGGSAAPSDPVPFLTNQRCIVLSNDEPGYAMSARSMRDGPDRGHIEALLPINDYKAIVGDIGDTYDLVKPLYASRKEGTAYRIRTYCPPDHVTLDEMVGESHPHGQCADLQSLNKQLVQRGLDMLCTVTMRANVNVRYPHTEDEEYFIGMKIETMRVHAYIPCQTVPAYSLGYAHHKSSQLLM